MATKKKLKRPVKKDNFVTYENIADVQDKLVGGYVSKSYKHLTFAYKWDHDLAKKVTAINPKRAKKRSDSYVNFEELDRIVQRKMKGKDFSVRMGVEKTGKGNFGERGDFCLIGASYTKTKQCLTLHYRSLELFGGLVYDQAIILEIEDYLNLDIKTVVCMCASTHSFALKRNSNEALYEKLQPIYAEHIPDLS